MKDRIDRQIVERAPWLGRDGPLTRGARLMLDRVLAYDRTVALAEQMETWPSHRIMARMGEMLAQNVNVQGLHHLPGHGPALIVANHPTGIADGIILYHLIQNRRPDLFFYANSDILCVMPQLSDMIAPVEWRKDRRSHRKMRETFSYTRDAVEDGRLGVIFPSGRLAQRRGLRLYERPWMASAATLARKFDLPVIPVHLNARNSALFYLFDLIHPTLRDITLFHEMLNKDRQPYRVTIGEPISASALPQDADDAIALLRRATLGLDADSGPGVPLLHSGRQPARQR
ncbi:hypothetical protein LCGC14_1558070 [marine sediment metagenome]|uniref:Phospholipid/glycerol acyltransferase domain-containing protein n=1 Tax=marine sediment metagenome TaxID=412755 RepID=A0A0F9J9D6_9ZZZZ